MKTSRFILATAFAAGVFGLLWQARTIRQLRAEVVALRKDVHEALGETREDLAGPSRNADQARKEKLELIRLRHQVRELNDSLIQSHARERNANLRSLLNPFLPTRNVGGPWNLRPEWKGMESHATNQYAKAMQDLRSSTNDFGRYLSLGRAAKFSLIVGRTKDARQFAADLLVIDSKYRKESSQWASGDAVHDGHMVLGRLALDEGRMEEAKQHLLAAGHSEGSPLLGSFGPGMCLAKGLLENGEQGTVLKYLELCRKFWGIGGDRLDEWTKAIEEGRIPDFGENLLY